MEYVCPECARWGTRPIRVGAGARRAEEGATLGVARRRPACCALALEALAPAGGAP